ncbi:hypothetical protein PFISCL1PPCAC_28193, partial [Pristionchus fissidentatus]
VKAVLRIIGGLVNTVGDHCTTNPDADGCKVDAIAKLNTLKETQEYKDKVQPLVVKVVTMTTPATVTAVDRPTSPAAVKCCQQICTGAQMIPACQSFAQTNQCSCGCQPQQPSCGGGRACRTQQRQNNCCCNNNNRSYSCCNDGDRKSSCCDKNGPEVTVNGVVKATKSGEDVVVEVAPSSSASSAPLIAIISLVSLLTSLC